MLPCMEVLKARKMNWYSSSEATFNQNDTPSLFKAYNTNVNIGVQIVIKYNATPLQPPTEKNKQF